MDDETPQAVWHERYATIGNVIVASAALLMSVVGIAVSVSVANERRFSAIEQQQAIIKDRQDGVLTRNNEQDARIMVVQSQLSAQIEVLRQTTVDLQRQLAIHDAVTRGSRQ